MRSAGFAYRGTRRITADEVEQGHSESVFRGERSSMGP